MNLHLPSPTRFVRGTVVLGSVVATVHGGDQRSFGARMAVESVDSITLVTTVSTLR